MTKERKKAIERITTYIQFKCRGEDLVALNTAIQALEQEPINVVLEKIRTEIEQLETFGNIWVEYEGHTKTICKSQVLKIIDKYKTESEKKKK